LNKNQPSLSKLDDMYGMLTANHLNPSWLDMYLETFEQHELIRTLLAEFQLKTFAHHEPTEPYVVATYHSAFIRLYLLLFVTSIHFFQFARSFAATPRAVSPSGVKLIV
jgi:hypothetical protein